MKSNYSAAPSIKGIERYVTLLILLTNYGTYYARYSRTPIRYFCFAKISD